MRRVMISTALVAVCASVAIAAAGSASGRPWWNAPAHAVVAPSTQSNIGSEVLAARLATAKYVNNLARAKADGYRIITRMIPNMGYHFMNPKVTGFDVRRPAILVYEHHGKTWQLGALEWVFPTMPAKLPLPGATYGVFGAACHYVDGTFVFATAQAKCAPKSPQTGSPFSFWHPRLITLHFWVWYPNSSGLYVGTNPMVTPFNGG
jgi:hypothetical protein